MPTQDPQKIRRTSRPVWGAWIEMDNMLCNDEYTQSRPVWGAWIEIRLPLVLLWWLLSRPVWGAWIEIGKLYL